MHARSQGELDDSPARQAAQPERERVRVGVVVDGLKLGGWRKAVFNRLLASPDVRLAVRFTMMETATKPQADQQGVCGK
jgi:hypothetical protein